MYEVFWNDRKIVITTPENIQFIKATVRFENLDTIDKVRKWFLEFIDTDDNSAVLTHAFPEKFLKEIFSPAFKTVPASGGVVIRNDKLLFIFRNEKWDLPKGKIDPEESSKEAALREVAEECRIEGHQIIKILPSTFHIYPSPYINSFGQWILKETHWFEMSYSGNENGVPQTSENISAIKWFAKNELEEVLANTYESLKSIISIYKLSR
jgi:8-oxo-dGTP pyrophosphatase MutT (NUDIX family)